MNNDVSAGNAPTDAERIVAQDLTIRECCDQLRRMGCAVAVMTPDDLRGADVESVEQGMILKAWDVIEQQVGPPDDDGDDAEEAMSGPAPR